jgi:hypothetical protein
LNSHNGFARRHGRDHGRLYVRSHEKPMLQTS